MSVQKRRKIARETIKKCLEYWDGEPGPETVLKELFNCREVEIKDGSVWIADPQVGHYLETEDLERAAERLSSHDLFGSTS